MKVRRVGSPFSQASTSSESPAWKSRRSRSFIIVSLPERLPLSPLFFTADHRSVDRFSGPFRAMDRYF
jgi:hypothetical protein